MRPSPMGDVVTPPVLGGAPFPVGNNSMPPVASPRLGTSGCDYTGRIEFDKKPRIFFSPKVLFTTCKRYGDMILYAPFLHPW